jgi:hypothetical protein
VGHKTERQSGFVVCRAGRWRTTAVLSANCAFCCGALGRDWPVASSAALQRYVRSWNTSRHAADIINVRLRPRHASLIDGSPLQHRLAKSPPSAAPRRGVSSLAAREQHHFSGVDHGRRRGNREGRATMFVMFGNTVAGLRAARSSSPTTASNLSRSSSSRLVGALLPGGKPINAGAKFLLVHAAKVAAKALRLKPKLPAADVGDDAPCLVTDEAAWPPGPL